MKPTIFGASLPDEQREPQRFATRDPFPHIPLITDDDVDDLPSLTDAMLYLAGAGLLAAGCFLLMTLQP